MLPCSPVLADQFIRCSARGRADPSGKSCLAYTYGFQSQQPTHLFQYAGLMAHAKGDMMRRSLLAPAVHEEIRRQTKSQPAVGIAR